jgi:4-oxalocrotonate tautomerase
VPLVRVDHPLGKSAEYRSAISDVVYEAMAAALNVPKDDRFQVFAGHAPDGLVINPTYLGVDRSKDAIIIEIVLNEGRTIDQKRAFYKAVADGLHARIGLRHEDVMIALVEVKKENWSFGNGEMPYA